MLWTIFARQKAATSGRLYLYKRATKTAAAVAAAASNCSNDGLSTHTLTTHTKTAAVVVVAAAAAAATAIVLVRLRRTGATAQESARALETIRGRLHRRPHACYYNILCGSRATVRV